MINIGLDAKTRSEASQILNTLLADEYLLSTKTKSFHWNVIGPHFRDLHELFEDQYTKLDLMIDQIAERVRAIGDPALGTMAEFLKFTRLDERPGQHLSAEAMVEDLQDDHETLIRHLRSVLEPAADVPCDAGTTDFLTGALQEHEKMAWMLRSVLAKQSRLEKWLNDQEAVPSESGLPEPVVAGAASA